MSQARSENVSPTAYATGHLWYRLGLSHPALSTPQGKRLDRRFSILMKTVGGLSFDNLMMARHKGIDALLSRAIDEGRVGQVVEIAAGLTGRGIRMTERYGDRLTYVETDLPHMAKLKRKLLADYGLLSDRLRVVELNALQDEGPLSLTTVLKSLDPNKGTAVITEGLMNYLDPETAKSVWARITRNLKSFPNGVYLADVYLTRENRSVTAKIFGAVLQAFVRGRMHVHFTSPEHGLQLMREAGFSKARIYESSELPETRELANQPGGNRVRVLEAIA